MPQDVSGYRTSFPTAALPGVRVGKRPKVYEPVGVALPGAKEKRAASTRRRRVKKATGYSYPPVGVPLPKKQAKQRTAARAARAVKAANKLSAAERKKLGIIGTGAKQHLSYVKGGSSSSVNNPTRAATINKAIGTAGNKAFKKIGTIVSSTIAGAVFPRGARQLKKSRALAKTVVNVLKQPAVLRALGVAGAGLGAYAVTRKTKASGVLGDALVSAAYAARDNSEAVRMRLFRAAVAKARAGGWATSDFIRKLAKAYGFSTTNR